MSDYGFDEDLSGVEEELADLGRIMPTPKARAAFLKFGAKAARKAPGQFRAFVQQSKGTVPMLTRSGLLYGARGLSFVAGGGGSQILQTSVPIYAIGKNETDPILGNMTGRFTNLQGPSSMEAGRGFVAEAHAFMAAPFAIPAGAPFDQVAGAIAAILAESSATFDLGSQVSIDWGPLAWYPGPSLQVSGVANPAVDFNGAGLIGSGAATVSGFGSWDRAFRLDPKIKIRGKQSFKVQVSTTRRVFPAALIGLQVALYHAFKGEDQVSVASIAG